VLERLGNLLYWFYSAVALALYLGGVIALFFGEGAYSPNWFYAFAVLSYLTGLVVRNLIARK